jgi:hypothetical protein
MKASAIIEHVDEAEDSPLCILACFELDIVVQLGLHAAEEAFVSIGTGSGPHIGVENWLFSIRPVWVKRFQPIHRSKL